MTPIAAVGGSGKTTGKAGARTFAYVRSAHLVRLHGKHYLVVRIASSKKTAKIRIIELNKRGQKIRSLTMTVKANRKLTLAIPFSARVHTVEARMA